MEFFDGKDVCVGPVYSFSEAFEDDHNRDRGMVFEADVPGAGPWTHVGNPLKLESLGDAELRLPPPGLGEHTEEVLQSAGITAEQLEELRSSGAV
jgi:formyl-CoA transferase